MCGPEPTEVAKAKKCRSRQLFEQAEVIIEEARRAGELSASTTFAEVAERMAKLKQAVDVFDRLNRGL